MKVKIGYQTISLSKEIVASHMANLLTTRAIYLNKEKDFKTSFLKYKQLCLLFIRQNKKFVYSIGDDDWYDHFVKFQNTQHELLLQEIFFKFSDGSEWTIFLNDIANLKIILEPEKKYDKNQLLAKPVELVEWAQDNLSWEQIKDFAVLRQMQGNESSYIKEWAETKKQVLQYQYKNNED